MDHLPILKGIQEGSIKVSPSIDVPERETSAQERGATTRSVSAAVGLTRREERLIVDKLFPLASAKWPFNIVPVCWENPSVENRDGRRWTQKAVPR